MDFIKKIWKIAWVETVDRTQWERKGFASSMPTTFNAIHLAIEAITKDPTRLDKPFNCLEDGKTYANLGCFIKSYDWAHRFDMSFGRLRK